MIVAKWRNSRPYILNTFPGPPLKSALNFLGKLSAKLGLEAQVETQAQPETPARAQAQDPMTPVSNWSPAASTPGPVFGLGGGTEIATDWHAQHA